MQCRAQYGPRLWLERARHPRLHADPQPLVSVLIATYNRRELLIERALRSVQQQTYRHLEVIIVGDGCTDDTEQAVARLGDPRITFINLPHAPRPQDSYHQWLVAGAAPGNEALRRARGQWIAWLDDDDEFSADHVETLLAEACARRLEFVYGQMDMEMSPGTWQPNGRFPPKAGKICHGAVFYAGAALHDLRSRLLAYLRAERLESVAPHVDGRRPLRFHSSGCRPSLSRRAGPRAAGRRDHLVMRLRRLARQILPPFITDAILRLIERPET